MLNRPSPAGGSQPNSEPSAAEIRHEVQTISTSPIFVNSERLRRFLDWTVSRTLQGDTDELREYNLGRDVFDRGEQYDPRVDSIVRVEARRLRTKLHEYYEKVGTNDSILIEYRPGSYIPSFRRRTVNGPALAVREAVDSETAPELDPRTVAVLPFANLAGDEDNDYFAYGVSEEILNTLATLSELKVVARTSSFRFGHKPTDARQIGKQLNAGTLVEGSVRRADNNLRVSASAVDARTGNYLWSATFDREIHDVFAIEQDIARAVAERLRVSVVGFSPAPRLSPDAVDAYSQYLRGRHHWNKLTLPDIRRAVEDFRRAASLFPHFASMYAGLADAYNWLVYFGGERPNVVGPMSRRAALQALRLDPCCAEAYVALGSTMACFHFKWADGLKLIQRGLEYQPSYVPGHVQHAFILHQVGDLDGARKAAEIAARLDPLSVRAHRGRGFVEFLSRDFERAINSFQCALTIGPEIQQTILFVARCMLQMGRIEETIQLLQPVAENDVTGLRLGVLAEALGAAGRTIEAMEIINRLTAFSEKSPVAPMAFVAAYAGVRDWKNTLLWLEKACQERWAGMMALKLDPRYDALQSEPRFRAILECMNLS